TTSGQYQVNGSQISSANLSNDANLAKLNGTQTFSGANTFSNASNSFTGDGSGLTNLNATNLASGTVDNSRLNADVALTDRNSQTFTGNQQLFENAIDSTTAFQIQDHAGTDNLFIADTTNHRVGIGKAPTLGTLDVNGDIYQSGNKVCDTSGNCVGTGSGGAIGGSGTAGTLAVFTGSGFTIGDSNLSQSGGVTTNTGDFKTTGNFVQGANTGSTTTCSSGNVLQNAVVSGGIITGGSCVANGAGATTTLAQVYANGSSQADETIALDSTRNGVLIRDNATPISGTLFGVQNSAGSTKYLDV